MTDPKEPSRPPLVLIANDQEWSARSLESILAPNGYAVLRAYTGQQALERARAARPDLVILDAQMPDITGMEVCRLLRADRRFSATTPIIITTAGPSGRAQRLEAYRSGAWELLGQPLDGESLLLKLTTFLASKLEADRYREETLLDHVSGLYNMRGLSRRAREIGSEAYRLRQPLACVVFTPAGLETSDGVQAFDEVAERVGRVLRAQGRAGDAIGRLGDQEFGVIAPGTPESGIPRLVDRFERVLASGNGAQVPLRLQAGYCAVADFAVSPVDAVEMLLRATSALRQLRQAGSPARLVAFEQAESVNSGPDSA
jgi:PleD family two-component response regulator